MTQPTEPRITRAQLIELLERASELQARDEREDSLTLSEVEAVAEEAGIDRAFVRAAVQAARPSARVSRPTRMGAPSVWVAECTIDGEASDDEAHHLIAEIQAALPLAGGAVEHPAEGVWRLSNASRAHVQVTSRAGETRVAIVSDRRRLRLGLLGAGGVGGGFVGAQVAAGFAFVAAPFAPDTMAVAIAGGGLLGGLVGVTGALVPWWAAAARWRGRARRTLARVADALALRGSQGEARNRAAPVPLETNTERGSRGAG